MTADVIALSGLCLTMLLTLLGFVWWTATTATSHKLRIADLELDVTKLIQEIKEANREANLLRRDLWDLTTKVKVTAARTSSQGNFDNAGTDPPPRNR